jgi:hypothetical protein
MVKGYVNWLDEAILSEDDFEVKVAELATEKRDNDVEFASYLESRFSIMSVFDMDTEDKAEVQADFADWCEHEARNELLEYWNEFTM